MKKTLKNLLYACPILISSFLPAKQADAQMIKISNPTKREIKGKPKINSPNSVYANIDLGLSPIQGFGFGYSRKITPRLSQYIFLSKGRYKSPFNLLNESEKMSIKYLNISFGGMLYEKEDFAKSKKAVSFISLGSSYNFLDEENNLDGMINKKALRKLSFEIGSGARIDEKVTSGFFFDPFRIQGKMYLGVVF